MDLKLVERLDFTLPDFTRLSWVSEEARQVWEPRLQRISRAWSDIEWLSVLTGVRRCNLTRLSPEALLKCASQWLARGLSVQTLQIEGASDQPYVSTACSPEPGRLGILCVVVGTSEAVSHFQRAWNAHDNQAIGALLGYPACCREFFQRIWVEQNCVDTTWAMATNTVRLRESATVIELSGPSLGNILWRWMGIRAVPHLPCRFDCVQTVTLGERLLQVGKQAGYGDEMQWIEQILSWPVEWSALHGIAEIKTPVLKVSTRTDATARKYVVRWQGKDYPQEGATGLAFPYQTPARPLITGSRAFQQGLDYPIQVAVHRPEWYHLDNGFRSRHQMDLSHRPIVTLARKKLAGIQGNILDLGCGNGALLKKICQGYEGLIPYGVDINDESLRHAEKLLLGLAENFTQGNFFNLETWSGARRYALAILMIGRLLEVPEQRANELVTALERECDRVLVYVYPGWSNETLEILARRAGFDLSEVNGNVGMIKFQSREGEEEKEYKRIMTSEIVGTPLPSFSLSDMLANRKWWSFSDPFPHIVAQNVFTESIYRDLETAFQAILSQGLSNQASTKQLTHTMKGYDAYGMSFAPELTGPFSFFLSRAWHDMLATLVGVNATGDINGGLHHHSIGSASGHLHNDLNPGWFVDCPRADGINVSHPELCSYHHGDTYKTGLRARETIRAVAMIYYLNNPSWQPGDGGETGLYRNASNPVDQPVATVPPLNNSLLVFECTPYSYHSFIKNWRQPRNSVILWLHRPKAAVISRWGEEKIVYWPKR